MNKLFRSLATLCTVTALLATSTVPLPALAATNTVTSSTISIKAFPDLAGTHWAHRYVARMQIRNVINGYEDGTFQPNKPVKQIEALVMAIRLLGLEQEAKAVSTTKLELPKWKDVNKMPVWAKQYAATALKHGLVSSKDADFLWNGQASRVWVARLIIRMVDLEQEALASKTLSYSFTDKGSIPAWAVGYVETGMKHQLLFGFADNSYKPNEMVTRAQIATYLTRTENYLGSDQVLMAKLEAVDSNRIIFRDQDNNLREVKLSQVPLVYFGDSQQSFNLLKTGDEVILVFAGSTLSIIEGPKEALEEDRNKISGELFLITANPKLLTLKDNAGNLKTYTFTDKTEFYLDETKLDLSDLVPGDELELTVNNGVVTKVLVVSTSTDTIKGEIISINTAKKVITLIDSKKQLVAGYVTNATDIEDEDEDELELSDLGIGSEITVVFGEAQIIDSIQVDTDNLVSNDDYKIGELYELDTDDDTMRIRYEDGTRESFELASNIKYATPDDSTAKAGDFDKYDPILIELDADSEVTKIIKGEVLEGEVVSVDEEDETIRIKLSDGTRKTLVLHDDCDIKEGSRTRDLDDVDAEDNVKLTVIDDLVYILSIE